MRTCPTASWKPSAHKGIDPAGKEVLTVLSIFGGTTEIQKEIIARSLGL